MDVRSARGDVRRILAVVAAAALTATSCQPIPPTRKGTAGVRILTKGETASYEVSIDQTRRATGLTEAPALTVGVKATLTEQTLSKDTYAVVVADLMATGEERQVGAANALKGKRAEVNLELGTITPLDQLFGGGDDPAVTDALLLFRLVAPLLPSRDVKPGYTWTPPALPLPVRWTGNGLTMTVNDKVASRGSERGLATTTIDTTALGNASFRLPLVREAPAPQTPQTPQSPQSLQSQPKQQPYLVDQLFQQLFAIARTGPAGAIGAAIASIPLAVLAPFLAIGEAIGRIFSFGKKSTPQPQAPVPPPLPVLSLQGPVQLRLTSVVYDTDGRQLHAAGTGTAHLSGSMPSLSGQAASLSGKPVAIETSWTYASKLTSPWPKPVDYTRQIVLAAAALLVLAAALATILARRRRRRTGAYR